MYMNLQTLRRWPELSLLSVFGLLGLGLFTLTDPGHVPPAVLVFSFFVVFGLFYSGLRLVGRYTGLSGRLKRVRYNGLLLGAAALPVLLLALQSIGQLTIRDTLTLGVIFVAVYFYAVRQQA
jgi:hypothetical protein